MTADDVRKLLKEACNGNQAAWAAKHGLSAPYVSDVVNGRREPGAAMLRALRLRRVVHYEPGVFVKDGLERWD